MKELHLPLTHQILREQTRRSMGEHDVEPEENTPTDAPDVENHQLLHGAPRVPARHHPQNT